MHKFMEVTPNLYDVKSGKLCSSYERSSMNTQSIGLGRNTLIFMRESETTKKDAFLQFSRSYSPGCILDLRIAPRLDVFYGSRKLSFDSFKEFDIDYFDFFGRIGVESNGQIPSVEFNFVEACIYFLSSDRYQSRPIVLFFDNDETLYELSKCLSNSFYLDLLPIKTLNIAEYKSGLLKIKTLVG